MWSQDSLCLLSLSLLKATMKLKLHKTKSNKKIYFPQFEANKNNGLSKSKELDSFYISSFVQHETLETNKPSTQAKTNERQPLESKRRSRGMKMIQQSPYQSKARHKIGKKSKVEIRSKRMEAYFLINRHEIEVSPARNHFFLLFRQTQLNSFVGKHSNPNIVEKYSCSEETT